MRTRLVLAGSVLALAPAARAQSDADVAARRHLIEQAQAARTSGDHAQALELAERAGRIQMTPSLRMFIAQEEDAAGHLSAALGTADLCVRETRLAGASLPDHDAVLRTCQGLLTSLHDRVGHVTVRVPEPVPQGLSVRVGGEALSDAFYNVPYSVDPGTVPVEATTPDGRSFHGSVTVAAGQDQSLEVVLGPAPRTATTTTRGSTVAPVVVPHHAPSPWPFVVIGAGALALGASAVFLVLRSQALEGCTVDGDVATCDTQAHLDAAPSSQGYTTAANVALGAGLGLLAVGTLWFVLSRHHGEEPATHPVALDVTAPPRGDGLVLTLGGAL